MSVPARTTVAAVELVLGKDYDTVNLPSLQPYIDWATSIVDTVLAQAPLQNRLVPTALQAELIERYLAAHGYTKSDPTYTSKSTGGASGSFVRGPKEPEPYKDAAIGCDPSGLVNALLNRLVASASWIGKPVNQQVPYKQRN